MSTSFFTTRGVDVAVADVSKTYKMPAEDVQALRHVDWEVRKGQAVAIMGPSGCGKSTLLNLLGGVDRPSGGRVEVDGMDVGSMDERGLEVYRLRKVGFVFQFYNLIPSISAIENIELPMIMAGQSEAQSRERAQAILDLVGLAHKALKRPEELSGGEQQRVGVGLALANDPALILADEPTGNLDSVNADAIARLLVSLSSDHGKTVIMVSHDANTVAHFPTTYAMRDGRFES
ncbi:MAG: ABC transporter ATP-binding protein [Acidobacteriota bacterium]|nr:ABC transporter ATP-binding protein [Acidobacteriota bacterium]